jgi:CRP/FNR family cyclic AMP-dependent transcriptional regulator
MNATHPILSTPTTPPRWRPPASTVSLLDADPELGAHLSPERLALARSELRVGMVRLRRGEWAGDEPAADAVGLLLVGGVVAREVVIDRTVSSELLGAGDLIRPWAGEGEPKMLRRHVRWHVLADARLAVLGRRFGAALVRFPEVNVALLDRACAHAQRLATTQAISHLTSVERRLIALFWHLAERWGRVTGDGVVVPLTLSHRLLGELVGARRPTVTTALATLRREGRLLRRDDATWLLLGEPAGTPAQTGRAVAHRRRLLREVPPAARTRRTAGSSRALASSR